MHVAAGSGVCVCAYPAAEELSGRGLAQVSCGQEGRGRYLDGSCGSSTREYWCRRLPGRCISGGH